MVEHLAVNQTVAGSSPAPPALGIRRKVKESDKITRDMWGKTGIITEVRGYKPSPPPAPSRWYDDQTFNRLLRDYERDEFYRRKNHISYFFLKFWVPNRCVGLWLTEEMMEEV